MRLLSRVQARNERWFQTLEGRRFRGVLHPVDGLRPPAGAFVSPRQILRVRPSEPARAGDLFRDTVGRVFLIGDYDPSDVTRAHSLFLMTGQVSWKRAGVTVHPVTLLRQATALVEQGPIWAAVEPFTGTSLDPGLRFQTERLRVITPAALALNDEVDGKTVKRVTPALGLTVAEIE